MKRPQARPVDPVAAVKVRLAIRWQVPVEDISDQRVRDLIEQSLAERGEQTVGWLR